MRGRAETLHGLALVLFAALVPVGEGIAIGALVLLTLIATWRWSDIDRGVLARRYSATVLRGLGIWLIAGLGALWLGTEGWRNPGELGRWVPLVAIPVVAISVASLPVVWFRRTAYAFTLSLLVAALFGLAQFGLNIRPGESLARARADLPSQARLPSDPNRSVAGGFYFHRLKMAHVLLVGLGVFVGRQLFGAMSVRRRLLEAVGLAVLAATLALTFTRAAVLAAAVGAVVVTAFAPRRWRLAGGAALALAVVLALSVAPVRTRILSAADRQASNVRAYIWSEGVRVIADHPLGVGIGNYPSVIDRYYDSVDPGLAPRTYPHNVVLAAWAETGPLGLVGFLLAYLAPLLASIEALRRRKNHLELATAAGGLFGLVAIGVVGLTHDVLYHNAVALAYAGMAGAVLGCLERERCESP